MGPKTLISTDMRVDAIATSGSLVAAGASQLTGRLWSGAVLVSNAEGDVASASTTAGVSALACVADGVFVSGDDAGTLTMWSASVDERENRVALDRGAAVARAHDAGIASICVVADKSRFVTAGADARVRVWDAERARSSPGSDALVSAPDECAVNAAAAHPTDANLFATAGDDGTARVWDLRVKHTKAVRAVRERAGADVRGGVGRAYALAWAGARLGEALAVGYESGAVAVLETQETLSLETRGVVEAHADAVRGLAWGGPTGLCLASCGDDGAAATHAGELPVTKKRSPHGGAYARCVAFWDRPGDGTARLVSGGWDGNVVAMEL